MKKVVIVTNIPNPYRVPLFNELNRQMTAEGYSMTVIFAAESYARRKFILDKSEMKFDYRFLNSSAIQLGDSEKTVFSYRGLQDELNKIKPNVVITPGFSPATMSVAMWKVVHRCKQIIWSGSLTPESAGASLLRRLQRKILMKFTDATLAYGSLAKKYLISIGSPERRSFIAINTVDTEFFRSETEKLRSGPDNGDDKKHLTCIGYLSPRKKMIEVLKAVQKLSHKRNDFVLDIIGDGEDRQMLEQKSWEWNIGDVVKFHGFRQKSELPAYFSKSSAFLFQTDFDIWGLVLNEAMAAGVPCIVSPNAGASADLVEEGKTGFVCNYGDTDSVVNRIEYLLDHPENARMIGRAASEFIRTQASLEVSARGFLTAVKSVLK